MRTLRVYDLGVPSAYCPRSFSIRFLDRVVEGADSSRLLASMHKFCCEGLRDGLQIGCEVWVEGCDGR